MPQRKYLYMAGGAVVVAALIIVAVIMLNKDDSPEPASFNPTANTASEPDIKPVESKDIKTPTDNSKLTDTLNGDAAAIDTDVKNYENDDYKDAALSDGSIYN